jgi:signal peptidase I
MANPNGRKGSLWETTVLKFFRGLSILAERLTKAGAKDEGDIVVFFNGKPSVLELKATKAITLPKFWEEATVEAKNYAAARNLQKVPCRYVIIKRRQFGVDKAWVVQDLEQWTEEKLNCKCD